MNTYSTSPTMALSMARHHSTEHAAQAEVRATLRALRAEKRAGRKSWNPFVSVSRKRVQLHPRVVRTAH